MMWNYDGMGWAGWVIMAVTALAFWALVVFAVVALFRGNRGETTYSKHGENYDARQILDQRFARGEIDAAEYHARQDVLLHSAQ
jgi:putative membrane protein